jgi:hypothetical protein
MNSRRIVGGYWVRGLLQAAVEGRRATGFNGSTDATTLK